MGEMGWGEMGWGRKWDVGVGHVDGHVTISTHPLSPLPALKSERKDLPMVLYPRST